MLPAQKGLLLLTHHPQEAILSHISHLLVFSTSKCPWVQAWSFFLNLCFIIIPFHSMVFFYGKDVVCVVYFCILVTLASGIQVRDPLCTCWDASSPYTQEQLYKIYLNHHHHGLLGASLIAQPVKNLPAMQETHIQLLGWEDPLEKEMATHSSILSWRIPWAEEPGRLLSMGSQELDMT